MKYNYKCVVTKNGNKMFYKNVRGKWKRITNAVGMKATTGKRMYRMDRGPARDGRRDLDLQPAGIDAAFRAEGAEAARVARAAAEEARRAHRRRRLLGVRDAERRERIGERDAAAESDEEVQE